MLRIYTFLLVSGLLLSAGPGVALTYKASEAAVHPFLSAGTLSGNARVGQYIRIQQDGEYQVVVRASGIASNSEWPIMALSVDGVSATGVTLDPVTVGQAEMKDYTFKIRLSKQVHCVGAAYVNSSGKWGDARKLNLDTININPPPGAPEPALATQEEWEKDAPAREELAVGLTGDLIKKNRMGSATVTVTDAAGKTIPDAEVTVTQLRHEFLFGSNICAFDGFPDSKRNAAYKDRFEALFNYATLPFYWQLFEPVKGQPAYAQNDAMAKWCAERNIAMKGHPLLYDHETGVPPWSTKQPTEDLRKKHVEETIQHYKGKIAFWEVVNEPVNCPGLNIDPAFRWARAADPKAKLVINDFGIFYEGYPKFYLFIAKALKDAVPFDVVGIQAHAPDDWAFPLDTVMNILDRYTALGKDIHITEFFVPSNGKPVLGSPWRGTWDETQQADYAEKFYRVCFSQAAVRAISWWDFTEWYAWKPGGGMLKADCTPKPVYDRLKKLIHEEWWTKATGKTTADGAYAFTGFYGHYNVKVTANGKTKEAQFDLAKEGTAAVKVALP